MEIIKLDIVNLQFVDLRHHLVISNQVLFKELYNCIHIIPQGVSTLYNKYREMSVRLKIRLQ